MITIRDNICRSRMEFGDTGLITCFSEHPGIDIREFSERPAPAICFEIARWAMKASGYTFTVVKSE